MPMRPEKRKLTIITPSLNTGRFLQDTIHSILAQSYQAFEHIVIDGGSTDETLSILRAYPHIRWISEPDDGYLDAFRNGLRMAVGEYIMQCCVSDGYADRDWFKKCIEVLDADHEVSLVWGFPQYMTEDGTLGEVAYPQFRRSPPPQKAEFAYYWLSTAFWLPEGNFCVRKTVMEECFPLHVKGSDREMEIDPWLEFSYRFHSRGYLPHALPSVANFGRVHGNQRGQVEMATGVGATRLTNYARKVHAYRRKVLFGEVKHRYRDARGDLLSYRFSIPKFLLPHALRRILATAKRLVRPVLGAVLPERHPLHRVIRRFYARWQ
jgi:glycosyltransferase involved in cell wall biosynthesis